jgi:elongation factor Ts
MPTNLERETTNNGTDRSKPDYSEQVKTKGEWMVEALNKLDLGEEPDWTLIGRPKGPILKTTPYKEENTMTTTLNLDTLKELRGRTNLSMSACKKALLETDNNIDNAIELLKKQGELKSKEKASAIASEGMVLAGVESYNVGAVVEVNSVTDFASRTPEFQTFAQTFLHHILCIDDIISEEQMKITKLREALVAKTGENIVCRRNKRFCYEGEEKIAMMAYNHPGNKLASLVVFECDEVKTAHDANYRLLMEDIAMQVAASDPLVVEKHQVSADAIAKQREIFEAQIKEEGKAPAERWPKIIDGKVEKWFKDAVLMEQLFIKDTSKSVSKLLADAGGKIKIVDFIRYGLGEGIEKTAKEDFGDEVAKML